jgi:2-phosphosulfolactate phosphatase|tara:strand:+ start:2132 stop:2803 length:672 start_codon:yes stop_codon:yes gene_type:complete
MEVLINRCIEGARRAKGLTIVIDVFRASNTIITCLESGAKYVLPVGELKEAYRLKKENPKALLFGERGGLIQKGFDFGNSPMETSNMNLRNKEVILTTSAGSQGIVSSKNAEEIWIGSFANAKFIVDQLKSRNFATVTLLAIGNEAIEPAVEDDECAQYIKALLENKEIDIDKMKIRILNSKGADRLKRLNQEDDLEFCLILNSHAIIPRFEREKGVITSYVI